MIYSYKWFTCVKSVSYPEYIWEYILFVSSLDLFEDLMLGKNY